MPWFNCLFAPFQMPMSHRIQWALGLVVWGCLAGCTQLTHPPLVSPDNHLGPGRIQALPEQWGVMGKIAVQADTHGDAAHFDWQVAEQDFVLSLTGPWGTEGITLRSTIEGVALTDQHGRTRTGPTVESLSEAVLGWPIPWTALRYWIQAHPAPHGAGKSPAQITSYPDGSIRRMVQDGWQIEYLQYQSDTGRPQKIHAHQIAGSLKIKLWITHWLV